MTKQNFNDDPGFGEVLLRFCDGSVFKRRISRVRNGNEFKVVGGKDWWKFDGDVATRDGQDGTATLVRR